MNDFSQIARFISYMTTLLTQMGLFCFLAEALMEEVGIANLYTINQ